ncbi:Uncharacterised protein [Serratia entomophila]|nr:Uncharacterised protein [Serratia entomophila]
MPTQKIDRYGSPLNGDEPLIRLNMAIQEALEQYLDPAFCGPGRIRFDMVDKDHVPNEPTVCAFLYDIQEDLELRHGQARHYQPASHTLAPRQVHVRCCYLLTYWEPADSEKYTFAAGSQQIQVINAALHAVLNMQLPDFPSAFVRVIAPSEHLSGLGSFWQSMGDKPRLSLNFTVTIPISLVENVTDSNKISPVLKLSTELTSQDTSWEKEDWALQFKRALIAHVLHSYHNAPSNHDWVAVRAQLARLQVSYSYEDVSPCIQVAGGVDAEVYERVTEAIEALKSNQSINPKTVKVDKSKLLSVSV